MPYSRWSLRILSTRWRPAGASCFASAAWSRLQPNSRSLISSRQSLLLRVVDHPVPGSRSPRVAQTELSFSSGELHAGCCRGAAARRCKRTRGRSASSCRHGARSRGSRRRILAVRSLVGARTGHLRASAEPHCHRAGRLRPDWQWRCKPPVPDHRNRRSRQPRVCRSQSRSRGLWRAACTAARGAGNRAG